MMMVMKSQKQKLLHDKKNDSGGFELQKKQTPFHDKDQLSNQKSNKKNQLMKSSSDDKIQLPKVVNKNTKLKSPSQQQFKLKTADARKFSSKIKANNINNFDNNEDQEIRTSRSFKKLNSLANQEYQNYQYISQEEQNKYQYTGEQKKLKNDKKKNIISKQPKVTKSQSIQTPLPHTGINQLFMIHKIKFSRTHKHAEPMNEDYLNIKHFIEEYKQKELNRIYSQQKIVFDCFDQTSPYYSGNQYLDNGFRLKINRQINDQEDISKLSQFRSDFEEDLNTHFYEKLNPYYVINNNQDETLIFESRFESGNLHRAIQIDKYEYDLYLKADHKTNGSTQWFYFKIQNAKKHRTYQFHITNFVKPESSFNDGMKPLMYSKKYADQQQIGWFRSGEDIAYYQSSGARQRYFQQLQNIENFQDVPQIYTLSFKIKSKYDNDEVYLAYCFPYTYTDCQKLLSKICSQKNKDRVKKTLLCKTLSGNDCDMLIVTNFNSSQEQIAARQAIILTSRVHPGESNASFVMEGLLKYLIQSNDQEAQNLRNRFVFKIVPMLNPDGVIIGNYRCSTQSSGDLNRQWINPSENIFPEIYATKMMIQKNLESRQIFLFCDFHGHSRSRNAFIYGCSGSKDLKMSDNLLLNGYKHREKIFPYLFSKNCDNFNYEGCNFSIHKAKESTGRVVLYREFQLANSYTLECSFFGPNKGSFKDCHFNISMLLDIGVQFCKALNDFSEKDQLKVNQAIKDLKKIHKKQNNPLSQLGVLQTLTPDEKIRSQKQHQNKSDDNEIKSGKVIYDNLKKKDIFFTMNNNNSIQPTPSQIQAFNQQTQQFTKVKYQSILNPFILQQDLQKQSRKSVMKINSNKLQNTNKLNSDTKTQHQSLLGYQSASEQQQQKDSLFKDLLLKSKREKQKNINDSINDQHLSLITARPKFLQSAQSPSQNLLQALSMIQLTSKNDKDNQKEKFMNKRAKSTANRKNKKRDSEIIILPINSNKQKNKQQLTIMQQDNNIIKNSQDIDFIQKSNKESKTISRLKKFKQGPLAASLNYFDSDEINYKNKNNNYIPEILNINMNNIMTSKKSSQQKKRRNIQSIQLS